MSKQTLTWHKMRLRKVDPEFIAEVADAIVRGATLKQVARVVGVPAGTLRLWLKTGAEQLHEAYEQGREGPAKNYEGMLFLAVEHAMGKRAIELVDEIRKATKDDEWKSRAWLLERFEAEDFGNTSHVEMSGVMEVSSPDVALAVDRFTSLADAAVRALAGAGANQAALDAERRSESPARLPVARVDRTS